MTGRSFSYDASGNITQDQDVFYSQTKVYGWNHSGQIASVTRNGIPYGSYTYDYLHRMVVRNVPSGAGTMHRVHDLDGNVIAEYHSSGYLMTEYVWLEDRPIAVIADAGGTPRTLWVHTDHLERPILMTNSSGSVVWQASFLPFGEVRSITGAETLDYRFPGQWFQMEAGLAYNWHRHYDATTGRYVSPDPIGMPDGPSRYAYALNSPMVNTDPTGENVDVGICALFPNLCFQRTPPRQCEAVPRKDMCRKHLALCLDSSLEDEPDRVYGISRCGSCYEMCMGQGYWPSRVTSGSCIYPGFQYD